jgi:antitoxin (DNA-binding transcriptional repressor) of toxin-antitoxin stability system
MTSINLRQLRETRKLKAWLRAGKTIELRERNRVIARIVPESAPRPPMPDFAKLRKEMFGDRMVPGSELLLRDRGRY